MIIKFMDNLLDINDIQDIKFEGYQPHIKELLELSFKVVKEYLLEKDADKEKKFKIAQELLAKEGINFDSYRSTGNLRKRFEIFKRDNFSCVYCGKNSIDDKVKLHVDHIKPVSLGGKSNDKNLVTSCLECNLGKSDYLLSDRQDKKVRGRKILVKNEVNTKNAD